MAKIKNNERTKQAIWDVLSMCYGIDSAITLERLKLVLKNSSNGYVVSNREIRICISEMRKEGNLICSLSGLHDRKAGYFIPATMDEYKKYRTFYVSYAKDIFETIAAMDKEAKLTFVLDYQPGLFADVKDLS